MMLSHLAARLYDVPLLIHRPKLDTLLAVLGDRIGLAKRDGNLPIPLPHAASVAPPGIAVIPIYGTLVKRALSLEAASGLTSYQSIADQLDAAMSDSAVRGILLDIDSPGGEASGCFDLADSIVAARNIKPIWSIANDSAFSAAYAIASAADKVFVTRTGGVGSIGVIALHVDQSQKDAKEGLAYTAITAGSHKNDLSPHAPLTDSAKTALQLEVNRLYGLFADTIARNRCLSVDCIRATEAGLFFGQDAVAAGLADGVGTWQDALAGLFETISHRPVARMAQGFLSTPLTSEDKMSDALKHDVPVLPDIPPIAAVSDNHTAVATAPTPMSLSDAQEIAELCTLADCSNQISGFLSAGTPVAQVRQNLLARRAHTSPISSHISPTGERPATEDGVLLGVIKQRLSNQPGVKQ